MLLPIVTGGLSAGQATPPKPTLGLIAVDFRVMDAAGGLVKDLKPEDVTVKVDGKARVIQSLRLVEVPAVLNPGNSSGPVPPPYGSNDSPGGRTIVLVIHDESFRPGKERPLREAVDRFLPELSPLDRVALVNMPFGGLKVDFTNDYSKVREALSKLVGNAPQQQTGSEFAQTTRRTLEALTGLLESLAGNESPTTVMFFSSGLLGPRRDAPSTRAPGPGEFTTDTFEQLGAAASAARAQFYVIQPEDLMARTGPGLREEIAGTNFTGSENPLEGLEHLAGVTGGERLHLSATGETTLSRVTRETAAYYLATFEPESRDRNGLTHRMSVAVTRPGAVVRTHPAVFIPKLTNKAPTGPRTPRDMMKEARVFRDLPLRATAFSSQNTGDSKLKIIALAEPVDPTVKLTAAAAGLFDAKGKLTAQWTATDADLEAARGGTLMAGLVASPGVYRLRFAAVDTLGRTGSADQELNVELVEAGPLKLSAIALGLSRGGFQPRLQFSNEPVALAYFEIYGPLQQAVSVMLEIARDVNGPAIAQVPGSVSATSEANRYSATAALPIGALPAGDYVIRAVVGVPGQASGRVMRTLRKGRIATTADRRRTRRRARRRRARLRQDASR